MSDVLGDNVQAGGYGLGGRRVSFVNSTREIVFAPPPCGGRGARFKRFYELTVHDIVELLERFCGSQKNDCLGIERKVANYRIEKTYRIVEFDTKGPIPQRSCTKYCVDGSHFNDVKTFVRGKRAGFTCVSAIYLDHLLGATSRGQSYTKVLGFP